MPIPGVTGHDLGSLLHRGERARLWSAIRQADGRLVAIKLPYDPTVARHEYELLKFCAGDGIVGATAWIDTAEGPALVLDRFGVGSVHDAMDGGMVDVVTALRIGLQVARALARLHALRVLHLDLRPGHILYDPQTSRIALCDFAVAAHLDERLGALAVAEPVGHPSYCAPEQTGRLQRPCDARTDLYSLGATLYELLTGSVPFRGETPLEVLSAHIARVPVPVDQRNPAIPRVVARIVSRLLEKSPDARYQTAVGLTADLGRVVDALEEHGRVPDFEIGQHDRTRPLVPETVYGREPARKALREALRRVVQGDSAAVWLVGEPGSGRSTLLRTEAEAGVPAPEVVVVSCRPDLPPAAVFGELVSSLVDRALRWPEARLSALRRRLVEELGTLAPTAVALGPRLRVLLGPTAEPTGPETRSHRVDALRRTLAAWTAATPVVLVLRDVERGGFAAETLLRGFCSGTPPLHRLALVCTTTEPTAVPDGVLRIPVGLLEPHDVGALVADTLGLGEEQVTELAFVLHQRTRGHIGTLRTLVDHLGAVGAFRFTDGRWTWSLPEVRAVGLPESHASVLVGQVRDLPLPEVRVLAAAAVVGEVFDPFTVADITGLPFPQIVRALGAMGARGFVLPQGRVYAFAHGAIAGAALARLGRDAETTLRRRFLHHLLRRWTGSPDDAHRIVTTLQVGVLPDGTDHRLRAAEVLTSTATNPAPSSGQDPRALLELARRVAGDDLWQIMPDLGVEIEIGLARCDAQAGHVDDAVRRLEHTCVPALSPRQVGRLYTAACGLLAAASRHADLARVAGDGLRQLGAPLPEVPRRLSTTWDLGRAAWAARTLTEAQVFALPEAPARWTAILELLGHAASCLWAADRDRATHFAALALVWSLEHGQTRALATAVSMTAVALQSTAGAWTTADRLLRVAQALLRERPAPHHDGLAAACTWVALSHHEAWRVGFEGLDAAMTVAERHGDTTAAPILAFYRLVHAIDGGVPLAEATDAATVRLLHAPATPTEVRDAATFLLDCLRRVRGAELGEAMPVRPPTDPFAAEACVAACVLLLPDPEATEVRVRDLLAAVLPVYRALCGASPAEPILWFVAGVSAARSGDVDAAREWLARIDQHARRTAMPLGAWRTFLAAEVAYAGGDRFAAEMAWRSAEREAEPAGLLHLGAMALDRRWAMAVDSGESAEARGLLARAAEAYRSWGHVARTPFAAPPPGYPTLPSGWLPMESGPSRTNAALDLEAVLRLSQTISQELEPAGVVRAALRAIAELAGATRVVLVDAPTEDSPRVVAELVGGEVLERGDRVDDAEDLPATVISAALRGAQSIVLVDASEDRSFGDDPYIRCGRGASIACVPLIRRGAPAGVLLLEHDQLGGVFTPVRTSLVQAIAAQVSISLENAALFRDVERRVRERTSELAARNTQMRLVLDHVGQGLVLADRDGRVGTESSAVMATWFGGRAPATLEALFAGTGVAAWFELGWAALLEGELPLELCLAQLPSRLERAGRSYDLRWHPVLGATGALDQVLLLLEDVTDQLDQRAREQEQREVLTLLERLVTDRDGAREAVQETEAALGALDDPSLPDEVRARLVHTLKGNFGLNGLPSLAAVCQALEAEAEDLGAWPSTTGARIRTAWRARLSRVSQAVGLGAGEVGVPRADILEVADLLDHEGHPLAAHLRGWLLEPVHRRFRRVEEQIHELARRLDKAPVRVFTDDGGLRLDAAVWAPFWSALVHVLRNAVDHGLEAPELRGDKGPGTIRLEARAIGAGWSLVVSDDGVGIDWTTLAERARAGHLPADTHDDLVTALFTDGISTRLDVTEISGRGVGTSAVAAVTRALGGAVAVESTAGEGTRFRFDFVSVDGVVPAANTLREPRAAG